MENAKAILKRHKYSVVKDIEQRGVQTAVLATGDEDGKLYMIQKHKGGRNEMISLVQEMNAVREMKLPFTVQYKESFQENNILYVVMDYCEEDASQKIKNKRDTGEHFPEDQILDWFVQICIALKHIHDNKIRYEDINPKNILFTKYGTLRLRDFVFSRHLQRTSESLKSSRRPLKYLSPEILGGQPSDEKSDIWSLGCVLYELCMLEPAFPEGTPEDVISRILHGPYPSVSGRFFRDLRALVNELQQRERPSASEILRKPFILQFLHKQVKNTVEELQEKVTELKQMADDLERVHFGTTVGSLVGGVVGAAGDHLYSWAHSGPLHSGGVSDRDGVGIGVGWLGGVTGAASNITSMVKERTNRSAFQNIITEFQEKMEKIVVYTQAISGGLEAVEQDSSSENPQLSPAELAEAGTRIGRGLGGIGELVRVTQVATIGRVAAQSARVVRTAEVVTGVFSALFLALDVYFIVSDSRELHAINQETANSSRGRSKSETRKFIQTVRDTSVKLQEHVDDLRKMA
ncbi:hypothetical protein MATL_G00199860 [Megalops atlanticus]|uniref:non-specific serine/threonine protein kinase n=1 Tax=Megalops atlanticus TaxID=7932 RepID=A0A9D3PKN2_MEGAT|nr:hypothetical protein MATL_G00199860 [Megalops atlanticus]